MSSFLGLQVDHVNEEIHLHMNHYVESVLNEYKAFVVKKLRPKTLPIQPNYQLTSEDPKMEDTGNKDILPIICDEAPVCGPLGTI